MRIKSRWIPAVLLVVILLSISISGCTKKEEEKVEDTWPSKPITFLVPFDAGGSADILARALSPHLSKQLGVSVVVENKPGASGQIGVTYFTQQPDDGHTILFGTQPYMSANILTQDAPFKVEDFAIVNVQQMDPVSILVNANSPYQTLDDLINAIKERPGELTWGTIFGGAPYLGGISLFDALGLEIREVDYSGGAGYRTALLGEQVDFVNGTAAGDQVLGDQARCLAVYSENAFPGWPDAPPINEALESYGVTLPSVGSMRYIAVHQSFKDKYPERWAKLVKACEDATNSPEFQQYLRDKGELDISPWYGPEESTKLFSEFHDLMTKYKDKLLEGSQ